jgi:hypothetical protein
LQERARRLKEPWELPWLTIKCNLALLYRFHLESGPGKASRLESGC